MYLKKKNNLILYIYRKLQKQYREVPCIGPQFPPIVTSYITVACIFKTETLTLLQ